MSLRCRLMGHEPAPGPVWNGGRHFTTCVRCGMDLVRGRGMVWHPVPPGMKVVWKTRAELERDGVETPDFNQPVETDARLPVLEPS